MYLSESNEFLRGDLDDLIDFLISAQEYVIPMDPYPYQYTTVTQQLVSVARQAQNCLSMADSGMHFESFMSIRNLLEKCVFFNTAFKARHFNSYHLLPSQAVLDSYREKFPNQIFKHKCKSSEDYVCMRFSRELRNLDPESKIPGYIYLLLESFDPLDHRTHQEYRAQLYPFSFELTPENRYEFREEHYLSWKALKSERRLQGFFHERFEIQLESHFSFLSTFVHSKVDLPNLFSKKPNARYSNDLVLRLEIDYLLFTLLFALEGMLTWVKSQGTWAREAIDLAETKLNLFKFVEIELGISKVASSFDLWLDIEPFEILEAISDQKSHSQKPFLDSNYFERLERLFGIYIYNFQQGDEIFLNYFEKLHSTSL
jgi:hypothetical protein